MDFEVGEAVVFYPQQNDGDNIHFDAEVVGITKHRVRIRYSDAAGQHTATVTKKRLLRQMAFAA